MGTKTNICNLGKQFETNTPQVRKPFHNSKLKTKILALLALDWDNPWNKDLNLPDQCPNINNITFGCYNLPNTKWPPSGKQQAVYQSLRALREEEKVVLLEGVYYKTDNTTAICNQIKSLLGDYMNRKAEAEHLIDVYNTQLAYFYALYQYINATGKFGGFVKHWSNRKCE